MLLVLLASPAAAVVQASFYSKDFGNTYPHAFVVLKGTLDDSGESIDTSYGFTAHSVTPAVLIHSVEGEIVSSEASYIAKSDRHFMIALSDDEYRKLLATVEKWRTLPQPSYNLNHRNCVYFVADLAATIGLVADTPKALMKKPRSYLRSVVAANRPLLESRGATIDD